MVQIMEETGRIKRWRLILGVESEERFISMNGNEKPGLSEEQLMMDQALEIGRASCRERVFGLV